MYTVYTRFQYGVCVVYLFVCGFFFFFVHVVLPFDWCNRSAFIYSAIQNSSRTARHAICLTVPHVIAANEEKTICKKTKQKKEMKQRTEMNRIESVINRRNCRQ